jgi:hypothetical protein
MKLIKILKDTPFHRAGNELTIDEFKVIYAQICSQSATDDELLNYIEQEWDCQNKGKLSTNQIGDWFKVVEKPETEPLVFVYEDLWYVKDFDGMYSVFVSPTFYKEYTSPNPNREACVKKITIPEARELIRKAKFKKYVLYCTNDVNKKM